MGTIMSCYGSCSYCSDNLVDDHADNEPRDCASRRRLVPKRRNVAGISGWTHVSSRRSPDEQQRDEKEPSDEHTNGTERGSFCAPAATSSVPAVARYGGVLLPGTDVMVVRLSDRCRRYNGVVGSVRRYDVERDRYLVDMPSCNCSNSTGDEPQSLVLKAENLVLCDDLADEGGSMVSSCMGSDVSAASSAANRSDAESCGFVLPGRLPHSAAFPVFSTKSQPSIRGKRR